MNNREKGAVYEAVASKFLEGKGYRILEQNFRCRTGEIDIIAQDGIYLVFVEVKYRLKQKQGNAAMAVNYKKQQTISRVAAFYLLKNRLPDSVPCRFDVIAIDGEEIHHYENAFDYI